MKHTMTQTRLKFVQVATAKYGVGAIISKKQIDQVCDENSMPVAQWFYTSPMYKTEQRAMYKLPILGDVMPVVGHELPMNGNVPVMAQNAPELPVIEEKTDDQLMEEINNSFMTLDIMAESIKNGVTTSLIVGGPAGVGKSHNIEKVLGSENPDAFFVHGKMKATALYKKLYEFRQKGQVLIIDDSDELFSDELSLNILKHALDSKENRHISWMSEYELIDDDGQIIPKSFNYRGSMIFITNLDFYQEIEKGTKIGKHLSAFLSRSHYIAIDLNSKRKLFLHTINVLYSGGMLDKMGLFVEQQDQLIDYIEQNMDKLREITPRMAYKLAQLVKIGPKWKILADQTCLIK
jgi:hypothetical protein